MAVRVVVVGAGFGGLGVATPCVVEDVTVLDAAATSAGVAENTYPVRRATSLAALLVVGDQPTWGRRYSRSPDPRLHQGTAAADGLRDLVRTDTRVTALGTSTTCGGSPPATTQRPGTDVVVPTTGRLSTRWSHGSRGRTRSPARPSTPAQWRHDVDLTGKRVAVVGTGRSAIQFVPAIVRRPGGRDDGLPALGAYVVEADRAPTAHHRVLSGIRAYAGRGVS